jgi:hypothetical protein
MCETARTRGGTFLVNAQSVSPDAILASFRVAPDGRHLAYAISDGGSDWVELRIRDVETGLDQPGVLHGLIFPSYSWTGDGRGLLYARYERPSCLTAFLMLQSRCPICRSAGWQYRKCASPASGNSYPTRIARSIESKKIGSPS